MRPLGDDTQMNVLLDRDARGGYLVVAFRPGTVGLHTYAPRSGWSQLASASADVVKGEERGFRVEIAGDSIGVSVEGEERIRASVTGRELTGAWGLGVQRGGAGTWRRVRLAR